MHINKDTQLCISVAARPGSLGSIVHNAAFRALGLNFVYKACAITDIENAMKGVRALSIRGCGVSMPFKESVMDFLDEVEESARDIGALNTVVNDNGRLVGYNTDYFGARIAIEEAYDVRGKRVTIIGAGGAARAVGFSLKRMGAGIITIINRTLQKSETLALRLGAESVPWEQIESLEGELLVNATPVGMTPDAGTTSVAPQILRGFEAVFDVVTSPLKTVLVEKAEILGLATIPGYRMSLHQAAKQFELYTGLCAPLDAMEKSLKAYLANE